MSVRAAAIAPSGSSLRWLSAFSQAACTPSALNCACHEAVLEAFDEFQLKASLLFLAVDQALKSEFSSLLSLRDSLQALDGHVSQFCDCS